jgi:two-component system cell cycle sensor histidine kinase/response regulator CckA
LGQGEAVPFVVERHLRMDGTPIDVEVAATPVTFDGRPAVELVVRDLSIRNASEAALRESEARVRAIFDESSLGMMLLDPAGHALESNRALQQLLGYSAEELAAMTVLDYTHPADRDLCDRNLRDLFAGTSPSFEMEKRCLTSGGAEIWTRVHVSPVREPSGPIRLAVGMVEDTSDHKLLEDQLRQASKMEALGRLAGGVAHDFNNLLTVVSGYADLLSASLEGDERAADVMEIRKASGRAAELTSQLLAFGRRAPRTLERIDLNSRIGAMIPMLRRLLGEDVRIEVALDPRVGAVEVDPSQFDQVVMNLVVNARDAMPGGGKLELNTARLEQPSVAGTRRDRREWARIEIADSGFGIAPDVMDHIFEPFFTTKEKGRGTGLGLAMVYGIVQQMGGQVRVESGVGMGARFLVDLPLSAPPVEKAVAAPSIAGRQGSETVLLVEDEAAVLEFCRRALESEGYRVVTAGPQEALAEAGKLGRNLDLLVTDVVMPGLDGPTIAAALRASDDSLKVLFMSGYPRDREEEMRGPTAGGAVLVKPFTAHELCDAVRRALDRGAASDRPATSRGSRA